MTKEETVLQGMIDRLIEIGSCYGVEMNVEKLRQWKSRRPSPVHIMIKTTTGECGIFQLFG